MRAGRAGAADAEWERFEGAREALLVPAAGRERSATEARAVPGALCGLSARESVVDHAPDRTGREMPLQGQQGVMGTGDPPRRFQARSEPPQREPAVGSVCSREQAHLVRPITHGPLPLLRWGAPAGPILVLRAASRGATAVDCLGGQMPPGLNVHAPWGLVPRPLGGLPGDPARANEGAWPVPLGAHAVVPIAEEGTRPLAQRWDRGPVWSELSQGLWEPVTPEACVAGPPVGLSLTGIEAPRPISVPWGSEPLLHSGTVTMSPGEVGFGERCRGGQTLPQCPMCTGDIGLGPAARTYRRRNRSSASLPGATGRCAGSRHRPPSRGRRQEAPYVRVVPSVRLLGQTLVGSCSCGGRVAARPASSRALPGGGTRAVGLPGSQVPASPGSTACHDTLPLGARAITCFPPGVKLWCPDIYS